ncbi:hypothetical protein [Microbacterium foliorum]|nr:hypothetical protein [Microbacterium foliorum]CAH0206750.1 hypothetical protein SRABI03_02120 [Microbacterium foliorum]CAH0215384.1 hypothetical protein SRABI44_02278 [Microbacterium foliorum]
MNVDASAAHRGQRAARSDFRTPRAWSVPPESFDEREWQEIVRIAAANVREADRRFRSTRRGDDIGAIIAAFHICGPLVDLPPVSLVRYARAVSKGLPFELLPRDGGQQKTSGAGR